MKTQRHASSLFTLERLSRLNDLEMDDELRTLVLYLQVPSQLPCQVPEYLHRSTSTTTEQVANQQRSYHSGLYREECEGV